MGSWESGSGADISATRRVTVVIAERNPWLRDESCDELCAT